MTDSKDYSYAQVFGNDSSILNDVFPFIEAKGVQCDANIQYWSTLTDGTLLEASEKIYNDVTTSTKVLKPICITALYIIGPDSPQIVNDRLALKLMEMINPNITGSSLLSIARFVRQNKLVSKDVSKALKNRIEGKLPAMETIGDWE